jgi:hypothetical protein
MAGTANVCTSLPARYTAPAAVTLPIPIYIDAYVDVRIAIFRNLGTIFHHTVKSRWWTIHFSGFYSYSSAHARTRPPSVRSAVGFFLPYLLQTPVAVDFHPSDFLGTDSISFSSSDFHPVLGSSKSSVGTYDLSGRYR